MIEISDNDFKTILRTLKAFTENRPDTTREYEKYRIAKILLRRLKNKDRWDTIKD